MAVGHDASSGGEGPVVEQAAPPPSGARPLSSRRPPGRASPSPSPRFAITSRTPASVNGYSFSTTTFSVLSTSRAASSAWRAAGCVPRNDRPCQTNTDQTVLLRVFGIRWTRLASGNKRRGLRFDSRPLATPLQSPISTLATAHIKPIGTHRDQADLWIIKDSGVRQ